jgi:hypothetical protein
MKPLVKKVKKSVKKNNLKGGRWGMSTGQKYYL